MSQSAAIRIPSERGSIAPDGSDVRASTAGPITAVGVTIPPWPGDDEAVPVAGPWQATAP
jgi:hypothetical protein